MRRIEYTKAFKRDWKRESAGLHRRQLVAHFPEIVAQLANDRPLPPSAKDHPLSGNWKDHRDCHVRPDLVLVYRKPDDERLQLVRLGSHSELFG
jgi:mRNA interferase YafQ